ncbi:L10-interacting MYB domain-containing protein-like isoform X2 [Punica granatum]|uniref:L10-interacting MYB domain-containing protein-like isoform X2 n=1 Tax=Punica granatum TaxID=22663 RepID=A0A6P8D3G5_PUNGR|nr:L10-interacting MYB domain-containing protein-like isoform X2 [Punica granatum]
MDAEDDHQHKQERSRTRWTAALDKIFADLIVKQIQLGNRPDNYFDKKTWNTIREEFNRQTDLNFNNNQLRKHLDVLRTRFHNLKSSLDQNEFTMDDTYVIGFDLWEDIGPRNESAKIRDCPIYGQLCTIFTESAVEGKYAQSSHYEEIDKPTGPDLTTAPSPETPAEKVSKSNSNKKKKRPLEAEQSSCPEEQVRRDQEILDKMGHAMMEMVNASKSMRTEEKALKEDFYSIEKCIRALDEIEGIEDRVYFAALDLFEEPSLRETFVSLKGHKIRLTWLQGKCDKAMAAQTLMT